MKIYFISGGPCIGKTSVIEELKKQGYFVIPEAARRLAESDKRFVGKSTKEINMDDFQNSIFKLQREEFENLKNQKHNVIFSDRGFGDTIAFMKINNLRIPEEYINYSKMFNNPIVFILEPLDFYEQDGLRQESKEEQDKIHNIIIETYKEFGYKIIFVAFMPIKERVDFILNNLQNL